jgi:Autophagocytosis associated protein, active-site domain
MVLLTLSGFEKGCERVATAFRSLSYAVIDDHELRTCWREKQAGGRLARNHDGNVKDEQSSALQKMYPLLYWRVERVEGFETYLKHGPVTLFVRRDLVLDQHDDYDDDAVDLFVDETLLGDADSFQEEAKRTASHSSPVHDDDAIETAWTFSIVHSHTWRCPVLYFTIYNPDGVSFLSHDSVLRVLSSFHDQNPGSGDTWEFVSMEEHPIFGSPAFMLHPCRTVDRLNLLFKSCSDPLINDEAGRILAWMALILPSVGFGIPSRLYLHLRDNLKKVQSDVTLFELDDDPRTVSALSLQR